MNTLSLFTGIGGLELAFKLLALELQEEIRCVGYVECNEYCQKIIKLRMEEGFLDEAPIFGDIDTFTDSGYARAYSEMVDIVSGGFPCQPFSIAGKKLGAGDDRNKWPATREAVEIIRPQYVFLENVPGLLAGSGYICRVVTDLTELGYRVKPPLLLGAGDCGAPHVRKRVFILAEKIADAPCQRPQMPFLWSGEVVSQSWWNERATERHLHEAERIHDGVPHHLERIEATGNAVIPYVAYCAFRTLMIYK